MFEVGTLEHDNRRVCSWLQRGHKGPKEGDMSGADNDIEEEEVADQEEEEVVDQEEDEDEDDDEEGSDDTGSTDYYSYHPPSPPFQILVSHVCRHWRGVALSTPSLWTTINIDVPRNASSPYENVSILLERSKTVPIDIYIRSGPPFNSPTRPEDDLKILSSLLVPHVQRWRSIKVTTSESDLIYAFLNAVSDPSVPAAFQLTALRLHNSLYLASFRNPTLFNHLTLFGGSAPNLTTLNIQGVHVDWNQSWISSASNLRYLRLACHKEEVRPTWAQFTTILRGAPQLETLVLYNSGPSGGGRPTGALNAPIQLFNLTDFVLISISPPHAIGFFPQLYLPSLKSLYLHLDSGDFTDLINQLARPATSPSPLSAQEEPRSFLSRLEKLEIHGFPCGREVIETLYGALENLQSLVISQFDLPPDFVHLLGQSCTLPGRSDIWLPRLKSLLCEDPGEMIRQVVQQRKDAGVPLKALYAEFYWHVEADDAQWFSENVETFGRVEFRGRIERGDFYGSYG